MVTFRRPRLAVAAVGTLAAMVGSLGPGAGPVAAQFDDLTVVSVAYSAPSVTVSGLDTVPLTVTVHVTSSEAIPIAPCLGWREWGCPLAVEVSRTAGADGVARMVADAGIVSGSGKDGVWAAVFSIPSTAGGTWAATAAWVPCMGCDGRHPIADAPTFTVEGSHQPRLTGGTSPAVVSLGTSPYIIKGRLTDSATGLPLAGATVVLGLDSACAEGVSGSFRTVTGSTGYYAFPPLTGNYDKMFANCIWVPGRDWGGLNSRVIYITGRRIPVLLRTWISAAPAATRVAVGTTVTITGSVGGPPYDCPIALQRLYGSTAWRTVDTGIVRMSGRYTLHARPSVVGANRYRVLLPRCYDWVAVATGQRIIFGT